MAEGSHVHPDELLLESPREVLLNEEMCIITSLNLYDFSQVNNNEMGVLMSRSSDAELYRDAYEEAQRIIRISDEVRMSLEKVTKEPDATVQETEPEDSKDRLSSSKLAQKHGLKTGELLQKLHELGYLEEGRDRKTYLTAKGKEAGGEFRISPKFGPYFTWPSSLKPS